MAAVLKRPLALLLASALLAGAPSAALAQSAGDQQYEDPLPSGGGDDPAPSPSPTPSPAPAPSPAPSGTTPVAPSTTTPAPAAGTAAAPGTLPRTGADPVLILMFGSALLLCGLGTRLLVPRSEG
jgi:hypothetical protein